MSLSDPRLLALILSVAVTINAAVVMAGWALGIPILTSWLPGLVQTKVNAAICLAALGGAVAFSTSARTRTRPRLVWPLVAVAVVVAGATLLEHVTGLAFGIDQALVKDSASTASPYPGRFAAPTAVAFLCAALAVIVQNRRWRGVYATEAMGIVCATVGGISVLGYLYGASPLLSLGSATQIALPAVLSLCALGLALVASNPEHYMVRLTSDRGIAGQVLRRILPAAVLVVPAGAWLRLVGERAGLYDETVGLSIMVAFEALVLLATGAWATARVQRIEDRRREMEVDLIRLGTLAATPLIEKAPIGLAVLDRELRCLYINPTLASVGGVSAVAALGRPLGRVIPAVAAGATTALMRALVSGDPVRDIEIGGDDGPSGRAPSYLLSSEPICDQAGEPIGLAVSLVEEKRIQSPEVALAAAAELRRQAQAIGESIPFGIWIAGPDGAMRYLSESFLQMAGITMDDALGFGWMSCLAPERADETRKAWDHVVARQIPWNHELVVQGADSQRRTILSRGLPIRDETGIVTSWAGINLDITDRKEAEAYRDAFTGILSHEVNTPITSIYAASTLLSRAGLSDEQRSELVDDISHESERLRRLVEDLVILARAERGAIQVRTEPVLIGHLLPGVCAQERRRWPDMEFNLSIDTQIPVARADQAFVEQIVRNLIGNAAKFGPPEGPVDVIADSAGGLPRIRVMDRGPGVDPQEAERLFEVFYRSERTSRIAGSGIGLFVAHRLVESIGGTIWARPRSDGIGAEFGFELQPFTEDAP